MNTFGLLLVDDEENIIRSLYRLFRPFGYKIFTATSGADALTILEREEIAVILSDQRMPNMIGSEFFRIVKVQNPETIRIILSGYTELESIMTAINDGAIYKFLLKPWDDEKLVYHIKDAFSHYELRQRNQQLIQEIEALNIQLKNRVIEEETKNSFGSRSLLLAQRVLNKVPIPVFGISEEKIIVMANEAAHQLLGREDLVGNFADELLSESICHALDRGVFKNESIEWLSLNKTASLIPIGDNDLKCTCITLA